MIVKVEFRNSRAFSDLDTGQTWNGHPIAFSVPGSLQALITLPEDWHDEKARVYMDAHVATGELVDWRFEHRYHMLGFPSATALSETLAVGDTFKLHGITSEVWERGKGAEGILIAIIDTGVDSRHEAFRGLEVIGDGKDRDGHGHGTHCASTAASRWGIASKARIYAGKGLDDSGSGSESQIANSIRAAADMGAKVISLSLGGQGSQVMDSACDYAKSKGAVVCCAAGNQGGAPIGSPARAADLIVMAHDRSRAWAGFTDGRNWSNPNRVGYNGVGIQAARANSSNGITEMSGTSMATPQCAGHAGLLATWMDRPSIISYLLAHREGPPDGPGSVIGKLDFGTGPTPPPVEPPTPAPVPDDWVYAIDMSYAQVTPAAAVALYSQGFRLAIQCLLAAPSGGFDQPVHRVTNLRNLIDAGFMVAGYVALRPEASGSIAIDRAYTGIPADIWAKLAFVAPDLEIEGLTLNHALQALARLHTLGKHLEVIYTNYNSWHDKMSNPPGPSMSWLWNASWDSDPDIDFLRHPFGGWTLARLGGEQYQGGTVVHGVEVDLNVFRSGILPGAPTPPPPPPPPVEPPPVEVHGTLTWRDGQTFRIIK